MIAESMDLLWGQTSTRRVVREGAQTIAGLRRREGPSKRPLVRGWSIDSPLLPDAAYMGLVLPMPGDMSAGGVVNDDDALPPTMTKAGTGKAESRSAPLSTDAGVGTG